MRGRLVAASLIAASIGAQAARADENLVPLAMSGEWIALAHKTSIVAPPDVCMAMHIKGSIAFRAGYSGTEVRVINSKWSLPSSVNGSINLSVGTFKKSFDITSNTDDMVVADVDEDDMIKLFSAMDAASAMVVTAGKAQPVSVSLAGSTKATNAFRTCARIGGKPKSADPEGNPFE
ncbi:hypothetical protein [Rhodovastum atsumiense]|uniref:Invasion associated locus B family protein n=1 Tax=Rhodovastum atsumiense TaxID=504468 RepID=A0A5M6IN45_9PROT|nr:hypothetical protein [Rhodovastum atsumiense]KAA5609686.1 hypothetical protein F1189_23285 [Rhodovastum atsumiense]